MPSTATPLKLLPLDVAADRLGVSERSLTRIIDRGDLPYFQEAPGCKRKIPEHELNAYIERHTHTAQAKTRRRRTAEPAA